MKISSQKKGSRQRGFILLLALIFAVVVGVTLGSYLLLVNQEDKTVVRSERWNDALAMAEAGVDEALAQMNTSPNNLAANGWGGSSPNYGPHAEISSGWFLQRRHLK